MLQHCIILCTNQVKHLGASLFFLIKNDSAKAGANFSVQGLSHIKGAYYIN